MTGPVVTGPVIAVLGLGEAGSEISAGLAAAGADVRAFDPAVAAGPGITGCGSDAAAAEGADVVLSLVTAHEAVDALRQALPGVRPGAIWADLNTSDSALKTELARLAADGGVTRFADVAMMAQVPGNGHRVPMLVSGPAARAYEELMAPLGCRVELLDGPPGAAADRKLVRSVFFKGLAAAITESLRAARAAGCEDWIRANIAGELENASAATVDRLEKGSIQHARRRADEMEASAGLVARLGVEPRVARAAQQWLSQLMDEQSG